MATSPIPAVDPQIAQLIEQESARLAAATPGATAPSSLKVPVAGRDIEFRSAAEIGEAFTQLTAQLQQQNARLQQYQSAASQEPSPAQQAGSYVTGQDRPKVDMERYVALIQKDPVAASEYIDELRYGVEKPSEMIRAKLQEVEEVRQVLVAEAFKSQHPEFPGGQFGNVLNTVREKMNLPFNTLGLEASYAFAKERGLLPDFRALAAQHQQQQMQQQQQQYPYQPAGPQGVAPRVNGMALPSAVPNLAPPALGRTAHTPASEGDVLSKAWDMTADQLGDILSREAARQGR